MQKMGWFGLVRGHSRSWPMPPFDRAHTTSYSTLIETMCLSFTVFYRAMLCICGTSHGPVSVCVCLCLCPCLSQAGVLLKRLNVGSHKQHHTIPQASSFLVPKISAKFDRGHPLRGRRIQVHTVGQNRRLSTNNRLYHENGTR